MITDESVSAEQANQLGDAMRALGTEHDANAATQMAAHALCLYNLYGAGDMARRRRLDVDAELRWFVEALFEVVSGMIEERYPAA